MWARALSWRSPGKKKMSWKNTGNFKKIYMKLELSIVFEEINDQKGYGSIFNHKLLS